MLVRTRQSLTAPVTLALPALVWAVAAPKSMYILPGEATANQLPHVGMRHSARKDGIAGEK